MIKKTIFIILLVIFLFSGDFGLAKTYEGTDVPEILPRSVWENTESLKKLLTWYPSSLVPTVVGTTEDKGEENKPPEYSSVERIIIHDMGCDVKTPGCNNKERDPIEIIQAIYCYQSATKGWGDIGYHYIIDYDGKIYEGRYGGNGVRGAHTYYDKKCDNFNVGTVGILLMGNYEKAQLPEEMYDSLIKLVAWVSVTNSLDPADPFHYSEVWNSPKKGGSCDLSKGGLTSSYRGPVVVGHGEIEQGNSDPGTVNLERVRKEAKRILLNYKDYLFTTKNESRTYTITNGQLQEFKSNSANFKIANLREEQLNAFLNPAISSLADGTLVKSKSRDMVYLIDKNKRLAILSLQLFNLKKYKWSNVVILSDRNLAVYPLSKPLTYPEGSLIRGPGPEVYLIDNETRRHITSPTLFKNKGFDWKKIITVSNEELLAHPIGQIAFFNDGTLIKSISSEVYLIKSEKRHWIKTGEIFSKLGYKWQNIIQMSQQEINQYPLGAIIASITDLKNIDSKTKATEEPVKKEEISKQEEPLIRVGIYSIKIEELFKITANGPYEIYKNDKFLAIKNKGEAFELKTDIQNNFKFISKTEDTIFEILSYQDRPKWNPNLNDNLFRGIIELKYSDKSKQIWAINELGLEKYLKGVAEAIDSHPVEYLKSLAIAARSYALFHLQNNGKYPEEIFHIRNWAYDQLYKGYGFELRASNIGRTIEETKGMIITYLPAGEAGNNKVARGLYSSDSGNITKDACKVWGQVFCEKDYDYLRGGIKDPEGTEHSQSAVLASHGVGISATGARKLAELGKTYQEILKYYYPGIEIEELY